MYEVELKVRSAHEPVRERLTELGAEPLGTVVQADTYYDAPHRDFAETDEALRIRRETEGGSGEDSVGDVDGTRTDVELTYKGPKVDPDSKTRAEIETAVANGADADAILRALGFEPAASVHKERERFRHEEFTVTLDDVEDVGRFVEVETTAEAVDAAREGATAVLRDLGLDPDDQVRTSYLGLRLGNAEE